MHKIWMVLIFGSFLVKPSDGAKKTAASPKKNGAAKFYTSPFQGNTVLDLLYSIIAKNVKSAEEKNSDIKSINLDISPLIAFYYPNLSVMKTDGSEFPFEFQIENIRRAQFNSLFSNPTIVSLPNAKFNGYVVDMNIGIKKDCLKIQIEEGNQYDLRRNGESKKISLKNFSIFEKNKARFILFKSIKELDKYDIKFSMEENIKKSGMYFETFIKFGQSLLNKLLLEFTQSESNFLELAYTVENQKISLHWKIAKKTKKWPDMLNLDQFKINYCE